MGCEITHGDTDSSYSVLPEGLTIDKMNKVFYDLYDEVVKPYNTICQIELVDPETKEKKIKNHFIVYEYEKVFDACIIVAKKRYYYKRKK
jgi:DNA polymerase elongation subunit (family B)